ncbi:MAG: phosphoribosylamine--glycine ligase [Treponema sp.]|nr:phosphoribosylamine--glycine ligase [Treponema sp.]
MKVLLIGGGGREHAIAWKLAESELVEKVFVVPGNGGTALEAKCENRPLAGEEVIAFVQTEGIALTVVGPEAPLAAGIVDQFRKSGLAIIGPDKNAARLEASKVFSKDFMSRYGVRTAKSRAFSEYREALLYLETLALEQKLVIKADGLAAGKGVLIAETISEAKAALRALMQERTLGDAGKTALIEEFLDGREVSVLAAVSAHPGARGVIRPFVAARDYKRRFDGNAGPNTGGMGAIAPVPDFSPAVQEDFIRHILEPTLQGMETEGFDYRGFIFFGLMINREKSYLLEYNARLGDPETQAVLPLMDADFARLCLAMLDGSLAEFPLAWKSGAVCAPVAVADGYPGAYHQGEFISIDHARFAHTNARLFAAGAELRGTELYTAGGRVFTVSAYGQDAFTAREQAYTALEAFNFDSMTFRKDIGSVL